MAIYFELNYDPFIMSHERIGGRENVFQEGAKIREYSQLSLFQKAQEAEILEAFHIYWQNTREQDEEPIFDLYMDKSTVNSLANFFNYLRDYKDSNPANLVSLTKRAVDWHDQLALRDHDEIRGKLTVQYGDLNRKVPVPRFDHRCQTLRHLSTIEEICEEAERMRHCVDTYIERVMDGTSLLFHLDHEGTEATLEFDFAGILIQADGPRNCCNAAVEFAQASFQNPYKL